MLTDINTKEFWEQVKKEYNPQGTATSICSWSDTFSNMWNDWDRLDRPDHIVMKYADEFLTTYKINQFCIPYTGHIFLFNDVIGYENKIKIRVDFLDYMINKLS